ncbi:MAG: dihydrolipoamide acetyltransferase family protein [Clostridia bacterium]|nr:dihydrolipoamide acetyltransferase family protein [Clostridia bacterium]
MAVPVIMPRQGNTVESCIVTKWFKKPGDKVATGDLLFSYETDKAAFEEESKVEGTLLAAFYGEGDDVPCLYNMCVIGNEGEDYAQFDPRGEQKAPEAVETVKETPVEQPVEAQAQTPISGEMKISPRARALASKTGADLSRVSPTGPDGRVIARDVQALVDAGAVITPAARDDFVPGTAGTGLGGRVTLVDLEARPAAAAAAPAAAKAVEKAQEPEFYTEPMTNIRKVIARSMSLSLSSMAQLTHNLSFDCTAIQALRKTLKEKGEPFGMDKISLNDIVMYAVAKTLMQPENRALNANLIDDGKTMKYFRHVNLGMAVDTDRGLMVPTIFAADTLSLKELSDKAKELAKACKSGAIDPDLLQGGSFTVSNVGSLGIESFTPVINPPQTGILGVCGITTRVKDVAGQMVMYPAMNLSLTYDHRALDGMPASRFLKSLKDNLESFTLLLARG